MKIFRRIPALVLALILAFSSAGMGPEKAHAENKTVTTPGGLILEEVQGQITGIEYYIIGYTDKLGTSLVIPEYYNDHPVVVIGPGAFMNNTKLKSVTVPASICSIRKNAFKGCTSLESVEFTGDAYKWRTEKYPKLTDVVPVRLYPGAFEDCTSLTKLELNYGFSSWGNVGSDRVMKNSGIKYLKYVVTDLYQSQDPSAYFNECPELEKIDIILKNAHRNSYGFSLDQIGDCPKLKEINIYQEQGTDYKGRIAGTYINNYDKNPIFRCPSLENVNVYVDAELAMGGQFKAFTNFKTEIALDGTCVKRHSNDNALFIVQSEGTAVLSCENVSFKVNLIVGGGKSSKKSIADAKAELPVDSFTYTGDAIEPYAILTYEDAVLVEDTDYTCEFKDNKQIGTATVTLKGMGDYEGELSATFTIIPPASAIRSIKNSGKKYVISWNKRAQADGYQIYYSLKKNKGFKKLYSGTDIKAMVTKLKSGMYIKVRTYKKVGKTTLYSEWSAPIQVK